MAADPAPNRFRELMHDDEPSLDGGGHVYQYAATPRDEAAVLMHETLDEWAAYVHDQIDEFGR